jgi:hypothetical protein
MKEGGDRQGKERKGEEEKQRTVCISHLASPHLASHLACLTLLPHSPARLPRTPASTLVSIPGAPPRMNAPGAAKAQNNANNLLIANGLTGCTGWPCPRGQQYPDGLAAAVHELHQRHCTHKQSPMLPALVRTPSHTCRQRCPARADVWRPPHSRGPEAW